ADGYYFLQCRMAFGIHNLDTNSVLISQHPVKWQFVLAVKPSREEGKKEMDINIKVSRTGVRNRALGLAERAVWRFKSEVADKVIARQNIGMADDVRTTDECQRRSS
ncbi:MAG: hypothetical protein ACRDHE_01250, partial [Ktedonobacterales bacterium]